MKIAYRRLRCENIIHEKQKSNLKVNQETLAKHFPNVELARRIVAYKEKNASMQYVLFYLLYLMKCLASEHSF